MYVFVTHPSTHNNHQERLLPWQVFIARVKTWVRRPEGKMDKYTVEGSVNVLRDM